MIVLNQFHKAYKLYLKSLAHYYLLGHMASFPLGHLLKYLSPSNRPNDVKMYYIFLCQYNYEVRRCRLTASLGGCFMSYLFVVVFLVAFVDVNMTSSQVQVFLFVFWLNLSIFPQGIAGYPLVLWPSFSLISPRATSSLFSPQFFTSLLLH